MRVNWRPEGAGREGEDWQGRKENKGGGTPYFDKAHRKKEGGSKVGGFESPRNKKR